MKICPKAFCYRRNRLAVPVLGRQTLRRRDRRRSFWQLLCKSFRIFSASIIEEEAARASHTVNVLKSERLKKKIKSRPELQPPPPRRRARYKRKVLNALKAYFVCYCASAWNSACSLINRQFGNSSNASEICASLWILTKSSHEVEYKRKSEKNKTNNRKSDSDQCSLVVDWLEGILLHFGRNLKLKITVSWMATSVCKCNRSWKWFLFCERREYSSVTVRMEEKQKNSLNTS